MRMNPCEKEHHSFTCWWFVGETVGCRRHTHSWVGAWTCLNHSKPKCWTANCCKIISISLEAMNWCISTRANREPVSTTSPTAVSSHGHEQASGIYLRDWAAMVAPRVTYTHWKTTNPMENRVDNFEFENQWWLHDPIMGLSMLLLMYHRGRLPIEAMNNWYGVAAWLTRCSLCW